MKQILLVRPFGKAALRFLPEGTKATTGNNLHTMAVATVEPPDGCPSLAHGDRYVLRAGDQWRSFKVEERYIVPTDEALLAVLVGNVHGPNSFEVRGWTHDESAAELFWSLGFRQNDQLATLGYLLRDM